MKLHLLLILAAGLLLGADDGKNAGASRASATAVQKLQQPVDLEMLHTTVTDLAAHVSKEHRLEVQVSTDAITDCPTMGPGITCDLKKVPLGQALRSALQPLGLDFCVRDEVVMITKEGDVPYRTWTDNTGRFSARADLIHSAAGQVTLHLTDGRIVTVPIARLSAADRKYVEAAKVQAAGRANPRNQ